MKKRAICMGVAIVLASSPGSLQAATAKATAAPSETDIYALDMAKSACQNQEFSALLQAMTISDAVRIRYSAPAINVVRDGNMSSVPGDSYDGFPIGMMDNNWITRASMLAWETNPDAEFDHVELELNQSQFNQWAVDWQVVRYDGNTSDGDGLGEVIDRIGNPGVLSFEPYDGCWRLIEDYRGHE